MTRRADSEDQLKSRGAEGLLMASAFSGCYAEDIKKGERVLDECKAKTKVQMLQGKGPFGELLCEEEDLFGDMLQNQMMQGKNLFGEVFVFVLDILLAKAEDDSRSAVESHTQYSSKIGALR